MDSLCQSCQSMLGLSSAQNRVYRRNDAQVNFKSWSHNALTDSCHLCTMLFYGAAGPRYQEFIDSYASATYELSGIGLGSQNIKDFIDTNQGKYRYLAIVDRVQHDSPKIQLRKQLEECIGSSTITVETVRQILRWMDQCSKEHDICQQYCQLASEPDSADGLPLRLINVDPNGEYLDDELRKTNIDLFSCENAPHICVEFSQKAAATPPSVVQYLTLSHRWSDPRPTGLNWENMAQFSRQIPLSNLATSFKDAIHITRCLGFRYLWIDSICINQVDAVEKASEISRMQHIYKHSQLNLSATSGEAGLIFQRNPRSVLPLLRKAELEHQKPEIAGATSQTAEEEYLMVSAGPWESFVDLGALNHRAWVVQERLLAPRVLHCCYNMVYWECPCLRASEVDPLGEVDHDNVTNSVDLRTNIKSDFVAASMRRDGIEGATASYMELLHPFNRIVRSYYFPMELTYPQDRLPAISGIARWFMSRLGLTPESYVAGLWRETLPEGLLWHFFNPPDDKAIRALEAAPSWSWASVISNSQIILGNFLTTEPRPLFQDLQTDIVPKNGDRFAQLDVAILRLQVTVIPVQREWRSGAPHMRLPEESKWYKESRDPWPAKSSSIWETLGEVAHRFGLRMGMTLEQKLREHSIIRRATDHSHIQVRWDTTDMLWLNDESYCPRQLYIVPILWGWGNQSWEPGRAGVWHLQVSGLILHRLPGKGQYERTGIFMTACYGTHSNLELAKAILRYIPTQALDKFSDGAFHQFNDGWEPKFCEVVETLKQSKWQGRSEGNGIGPDDHLGVNEDGLHSIEIL